MISNTARAKSEILFQFLQMNYEVVLNLIRADSRYFSLKYRGEFNNYWGIITETVVADGVIQATLSGIVKVRKIS